MQQLDRKGNFEP